MNEQNQQVQQQTPQVPTPQTQTPQSPPWYPQAQTPPTPKIEYTASDSWFSVIFFVFSFLFVRTLPVHRFALGGTLMLMLLFLVGGLYLRFSKIRIGGAGIAASVFCCILSLSMLSNGNNSIRNAVLLLLTAAFFCWIYFVCGLAGRRPKQEHLFSHALIALFPYPWKHLGSWFGAIGGLGKGKSGNPKLIRSLGWAALGLLCAILPTVTIAMLLSYDSQFTSLMRELFSFSFKSVFELIGDLILGLLVALFLFSGVFSAKLRREETEGGEETPLNLSSLHVLPRTLLCAAVTPILALYVLFFISQWDYYVSAFTHVLPEGLTYAAYARDGFFQLCTVCLINAAMLLIFFVMARAPQAKPHPVQRIYAGVISVFTLILISTALSKMILYIDSYGLTQKRVYASWAMILLAVVFIAVLLRQCIRKFPAIAVACAAACVLLALIALPNVDGMIANYNVDRYLAGELNTLDTEDLKSLDVSAVPAAVKLEKELSDRNALGALTDKERTLLSNTTAFLNAMENELRTEKEKLNGIERIFTFSVPTARARALLEERQANRYSYM